MGTFKPYLNALLSGIRDKTEEKCIHWTFHREQHGVGKLAQLWPFHHLRPPALERTVWEGEGPQGVSGHMGPKAHGSLETYIQQIHVSPFPHKCRRTHCI